MKNIGRSNKNTRTDLVLTEDAGLNELFAQANGYSLRPSEDNSGHEVCFKNELVAHCFKQHEFYHFLKKTYNIDWKNYLTRELFPDNGLFVAIRDTLFIIDIRPQRSKWFGDWKLQTCDFKRKQYMKLVHSLGWRVEYVYVLSDWFRKPKYRDVLDYIHSVNCHYMFNTIPLKWFGLPDA